MLHFKFPNFDIVDKLYGVPLTQVQLYSQTDIPSMKNMGFAIAPGLHTFVPIRPEEVGGI